MIAKSQIQPDPITVVGMVSKRNNVEDLDQLLEKNYNPVNYFMPDEVDFSMISRGHGFVICTTELHNQQVHPTKDVESIVAEVLPYCASPPSSFLCFFSFSCFSFTFLDDLPRP